MALELGHGTVPEEILVAEICERYGWTHDEYWSQPAQFLEVVRVKMAVENEVQVKQQQKQEREARRGRR